MNYSEFITTVLKEASKIVDDFFGTVTGVAKDGDNNQVLTDADIAIGKYLIGEIKKVYPEYNIIDEEAGVIDSHSHFTWVIDPIDGTSNFANGLPQYGIMIGLLEDNQPIAGGIALPFFKELYTAEKNKGAFCNSEKISVNETSNLLSSLVSYCIDGHQENPQITYDECKLLADIILNIRNLRTSGSAFDMAMAAKGKYGGYLNRTSKIWDNVAPQILMEEAGGVYTDFFGKPVDYSKPLEKTHINFTACAGPAELHKKLQTIIHSHQL